jgi:hypothetical protein
MHGRLIMNFKQIPYCTLYRTYTIGRIVLEIHIRVTAGTDKKNGNVVHLDWPIAGVGVAWVTANE